MSKGLYEAYRQAVHMFFRRRMKPLTVEEAEEKTLFWARCYAATSFVLFSYCMYRLADLHQRSDHKKYTLLPSNSDEDKTYRVIKFSGLTKVVDYKVKGKEINLHNDSPVVLKAEGDFQQEEAKANHSS